ncbi:hypothetical protein B0T13DRAFT_94911 [Neurospora crassa]|nr:hypothetical protein B0T13DRAFT_94911 [Neurospora crassa]
MWFSPMAHTRHLPLLRRFNPVRLVPARAEAKTHHWKLASRWTSAGSRPTNRPGSGTTPKPSVSLCSIAPKHRHYQNRKLETRGEFGLCTWAKTQYTYLGSLIAKKTSYGQGTPNAGLWLIPLSVTYHMKNKDTTNRLPLTGTCTVA